MVAGHGRGPATMLGQRVFNGGAWEVERAPPFLEQAQEQEQPSTAVPP